MTDSQEIPGSATGEPSVVHCGTPLWREAWGLHASPRLLLSPAVVLIGLLLLLALANHIAKQSFAEIWQAGTSFTVGQRELYAFFLIFRRWGLDVVLLVFTLMLLRHTLRLHGGPPLVDREFTPIHLMMVVLGPPAVIWLAATAWAWWESLQIAQQLAGQGDHMLWLVRRPGRITALLDPGPPSSVVLSHNILTGAIALLGCAVYGLWWGWVLVSIGRWKRGGPALALMGLGVMIVGVSRLSAVIDLIQGSVDFMHPLSVWMFPPGTATYSEWRFEMISPLRHFMLYMTMHLSLLILELGLVGVLRALLVRAADRLWKTPPSATC